MPEPKLSIVPCGDYTPETVRAALLAALDAVGGLDWVKPGMRIGIKLNLLSLIPIWRCRRIEGCGSRWAL